LALYFSWVYLNAGSAPAWNSAKEILWVSSQLPLGFDCYFVRGLTTGTFSKLPGNYYYFGLFMCQICLIANFKQIANKFSLKWSENWKLSSKDEAITSLMKTAFANIFNDVATLLEKLPSPSAYLFTEGGACEKCICRAMTASVKCRCIICIINAIVRGFNSVRLICNRSCESARFANCGSLISQLPHGNFLMGCHRKCLRGW